MHDAVMRSLQPTMEQRPYSTLRYVAGRFQEDMACLCAVRISAARRPPALLGATLFPGTLPGRRAPRTVSATGIFAPEKRVVRKLQAVAWAVAFASGRFTIVSEHASYCKSRSGRNGVPWFEPWRCADAVVQRGARLPGIRAGVERDARRSADADLRVLSDARPLAYASLARTRRVMSNARSPILTISDLSHFRPVFISLRREARSECGAWQRLPRRWRAWSIGVERIGHGTGVWRSSSTNCVATQALEKSRLSRPAAPSPTLPRQPGASPTRLDLVGRPV